MRGALLQMDAGLPRSGMLLVIGAMGLAGLLGLGASLLLVGSEIGGTLMFLARHVLDAVPLLLWGIAAVVVAVWLVVVVPVWRRQFGVARRGPASARSAERA
jgi:hypothetical protein